MVQALLAVPDVNLGILNKVCIHNVQQNLANKTTFRPEQSVLNREVSISGIVKYKNMGIGNEGVLFREVSSIEVSGSTVQ